jgi:hypothetical protein
MLLELYVCMCVCIRMYKVKIMILEPRFQNCFDLNQGPVELKVSTVIEI